MVKRSEIPSIKDVVDLEAFLASSNTFKSEKELCDFVEDNVERLAFDLYGVELKSYAREWYLNIFRNYGPNKPRIDFCLTLDDGRRIGIECKNPSNVYSELSHSLSQILSYIVIAKSNDCPFNDVLLVTTKYNDVLPAIIREFKLPIRMLALNKYIRAEIV